MVTLPVTLGNPNPNDINFCILRCLSYIFVVGEHRDFKIGVQVDRSKSHSADVPEMSVVTSRNPFYRASYASAVLAVVACPSVCPSVSLTPVSYQNG